MPRPRGTLFIGKGAGGSRGHWCPSSSRIFPPSVTRSRPRSPRLPRGASVPGADSSAVLPALRLAATLVLPRSRSAHGHRRKHTTLLILLLSSASAVAPAFACATHTVHRVLCSPFKSRARYRSLYIGNSLRLRHLSPASLSPALRSFGMAQTPSSQCRSSASVGAVMMVPLSRALPASGSKRRRCPPPPMTASKMPSLPDSKLSATRSS